MSIVGKRIVFVTDVSGATEFEGDVLDKLRLGSDKGVPTTAYLVSVGASDVENEKTALIVWPWYIKKII